MFDRKHVGQMRIGRYDCGIFLTTKSAAVCLFLQHTIKLMIRSARKQYHLGFWAFSQLKSVYIKSCQSEGFVLVQCILDNFKYGGEHNPQLFACDCWLYFEGIWNNYVDIQQKNMQARFTTF